MDQMASSNEPGASATACLSGVLRTIDLRGRSGDLAALLPTPAIVDDEVAGRVVEEILRDVKLRGDVAVLDATERFDKVRPSSLRVDPSDVAAALEEIPAALRCALEVAAENIADYHRSQLERDRVYERDGVTVKEMVRPVGRAGLYVPGGLAPLASSVLMTAVPARVAGVGELAACSPPGPDGRIAAPVLAAAAVAGVDEVYCVGGAQAIAALAYGTESVPAVDVIVGPGNRYVAIAERLVAGQGAVGVPSAFTGPSEVAVIADETTDPTYAAVDLVVQAEHGPDGLSYLITWVPDVAEAVAAQVARITAESPRRQAIEATFSRGGFCVLVDGPDQALRVANVIAAEHLELMTADASRLAESVTSAGAVFVGPWAPASVGDYAAGPNHVLPTARSARFSGALRVSDFTKHIHVIEVTRAGLERLAAPVEALAVSEGLAAHALSVTMRTASS